MSNERTCIICGETEKGRHFNYNFYCWTHYKEAMFAEFHELFNQWCMPSEPSDRLKYLMARTIDEYFECHGSYLTKARVNERGYNFVKMDNANFSFMIQRHPGAFKNGYVSRTIDQKWQVNIPECSASVVKNSGDGFTNQNSGQRFPESSQHDERKNRLNSKKQGKVLLKEIKIEESIFIMAFLHEFKHQNEARPEKSFLDLETGEIVWFYENDEDSPLEIGVSASENVAIKKVIQASPDKYLEIPGSMIKASSEDNVETAIRFSDNQWQKIIEIAEDYLWSLGKKPVWF